MKPIMNKIVLAVLFAAAISAKAEIKNHSNTIIVETPSDLPEAAQQHSQAIYLHSTSDGRTFLYLEQDNGQKLSILDVTDPSAIRTAASVTIAAPAAFDFVQQIGNSAELIRFRGHSGYAVLNLKRYDRPTLSDVMPNLRVDAMEPLGANGILLASLNNSNRPFGGLGDYSILDTSNTSTPVQLITVADVRQRLEQSDTGTLFLLNGNGLTVVRRPRVEQEYKAQIVQESHN